MRQGCAHNRERWTGAASAARAQRFLLVEEHGGGGELMEEHGAEA